jgi:hypothetical protein
MKGRIRLFRNLCGIGSAKDFSAIQFDRVHWQLDAKSQDVLRQMVQGYAHKKSRSYGMHLYAVYTM